MPHDFFQQEWINPTHHGHACIGVVQIVHSNIIETDRMPDPQPRLLQIDQMAVSVFPEDHIGVAEARAAPRSVVANSDHADWVDVQAQKSVL